MFERFTDRVRNVIELSRKEAERLGHNYIGPETILLGIVREGEGIGVHALKELGVSTDELRSRIESIMGHGDYLAWDHIPFTPPAQQLLDRSFREMRNMGCEYISTGHLLLALIHDGDNYGARVLQGLAPTRLAEADMLVASFTIPDADQLAERSFPGDESPAIAAKVRDYRTEELLRESKDIVKQLLPAKRAEVEALEARLNTITQELASRPDT